MIREECEHCGERRLSWREKRFGHCRLSLPGVKIKDRTGYHPSLARFPGDPYAFVDSDRELDRKVSQAKRNGMVEVPFQDVQGRELADATDVKAIYEQAQRGELEAPEVLPKDSNNSSILEGED